MVGSSRIGAKIPVEIIRKGKTQTLNVTVAELPADDELQIASTGNGSAIKSNALNITVKDLTEQQKKELEFEDHGVLVESVLEGPAQKAGIRRGDIILLINNIKVKDTSHFNKMVEELPKDKSIPILIQRRGGPIFIALKISED